MKKILLVSSYPYPYCGIAKYTSFLLLHFERKEIIINTFFMKFSTFPFAYLLQSFKLFSLIIFSNITSIHFQYTPTIIGPFAPMFYKLAKWKKKHIITTIHESATVYMHYLPSFLRPLLTYYENSIMTHSDVIIVLSETQQHTLAKQYPKEKKKFQSIPQGIRDIPLQSSKTVVKKYNNLSQYTLISFFGYIREGKGLDVLIDAYKYIEHKYNKTFLIIGGKSNQSYKNDLLKQIKENKIKRYKWYDFLPDDELRYLMQKSKIIILPYNKNTNSALLMDAVSMETPIIGSDIGSIREYIETYNIGITFKTGVSKDLEEKIRKVIEQPQQLEEFKKNEQTLKSLFSWEHITQKHAQLYTYV